MEKGPGSFLPGPLLLKVLSLQCYKKKKVASFVSLRPRQEENRG
jgi:hypothetical protein